MAQTSAASGLVVQQWDDKYFAEYLSANQFKPFMGSNTNSVIQVKEDLTKKPGDSVTFALRNKLTQNAVTGSNTMEGNEEDLTTRSFQVTIDQYRNAVLVPVLENQFSAIDLREAAKDALLDWQMELLRDDIITALGSINGVAYGSASEAQKDTWITDNSDRVLFGAATSNLSAGDHSASLANVDSTDDKLTPAAISLMKRLAKTASPKIRPIRPRKGGSTSDYYVLFAPSLLIRDLAENSTFQQANREARMRGKENPIFRGADYFYDGVYIIEVEDIAVVADVGASSIDVAPCYLCGAQAIAMAWSKRPETVEDMFDYRDKQGCAVREWRAVEKMTFGSGTGDTDDLKDHGVVTGWFSAVAD